MKKRKVLVRIGALLASVFVIVIMAIVPTFAQETHGQSERGGEMYYWDYQEAPLLSLNFAVVGKNADGTTNALKTAGVIKLPNTIYTTDYQNYEIAVANGGTYKICYISDGVDYCFIPTDYERLYFTFQHNNGQPYANNQYRSTLSLRCDKGTLYKNGQVQSQGPFVMSVCVGTGTVSQSWNAVSYPGWEDGGYRYMFLPLTSCKVDNIVYTNLSKFCVDFYLPFENYKGDIVGDPVTFFGSNSQRIDVNFTAILSMTDIDWDTAPSLLQYTKQDAIKLSYGEGVFNQVYTQIYENGFDFGWTNGEEFGYNEGNYAGFWEGHEAGYADGRYAGYQEGEANGHQQGWVDAERYYMDNAFDQVGDYYNDYWMNYYKSSTYGEAVQESIKSEDSNAVTAFFNSMWNGVLDAYETVTEGVSVEGITLGAVITTLVIAAIVLFVVSKVK